MLYSKGTENSIDFFKGATNRFYFYISKAYVYVHIYETVRTFRPHDFSPLVLGPQPEMLRC